MPKSDLSQNPAGSEVVRWPACSMLGWGTFGSNSPAGRRYHRRAGAALALMVACCLGGALLHLKLLPAVAPGLGFGYIAWEFRIYLAGLDELARRIQLESIAWTYLCGMVLLVLLGGLGMVYDWRLNPFWFILLEGVRGTWLYFVARRYQ